MPLFLIAVGLAGLLFGVGSSEVRRFENAAAKDISGRLTGVGRQVKVRTKMDPLQAIGGHLKSACITASDFATDGLPFFTQPEGSRRGRLDELKIELTDFELTGLRVKRLTARIPDCRFDFGLAQKKGQIRLTKSGLGLGSVEVAETALEAFVLKRFPAIQKMSIQLANGMATIEGEGRFVSFQASIKIIGKLTSFDGNSINLSSAEVLIGGRAANSAAAKAVLDFLNPVLNLDKDLKLFGALRVSEIELADGTLKASGVATIPNQPVGTWIGKIGLLIR